LQSRFAISPLLEVSAGLVAACRYRATGRAEPWAVRVRSAIARHRLHLLAALTETPVGGYLPDFLNPEPVGFDADVEQELHQVAMTPPVRIRAEMAASMRGRPRSGLRGAAPSRVLLDALQRGEHALAQRTAAELHVLWTSTVRPSWTGMRRRLEDDVETRTRLVARSGIAAAWRSLDRGLSVDDVGLEIESDITVDVAWGRQIVLVPSCIEPALVPIVDPCQERGTILHYRARPGVDRQAGSASGPAAGVLGGTRAELLRSLGTARTTQELSRLHRLATATVSYHLTRLHRAGLLTRRRQGLLVYYRRTASAETLLRSVD
jgi:DNA-binding transcriptional ArsR family regulator